MIGFIKRYWDILSGIGFGLFLTIINKFKLERIQLCYSIIILILVNIGVFRTIRQATDKYKEKNNKRKHNLIDSIIDKQKSVKAISLAQSPTKEGEKVGKFLINIWEVSKKTMNKLKEFFSKFKGFMLTIALTILTVMEFCGGFINDLCGGALTINGVEVLPILTLICATIVGMVSNGYTREDNDKIKALFSKSTTNELVKEEIKKAIKEKSAQLAQFNKIHTTKQHELANLNSELETHINTYEAKKEMYGMQPQLATTEEVQLAANAVKDCRTKITEKNTEIISVQKNIDSLTTTINALKNQL